MAFLSYIQTHTSPFTQTVPSLIILLALLQAHNICPARATDTQPLGFLKGPVVRRKLSLDHLVQHK